MCDIEGVCEVSLDVSRLGGLVTSKTRSANQKVRIADRPTKSSVKSANCDQVRTRMPPTLCPREEAIASPKGMTRLGRYLIGRVRLFRRVRPEQAGFPDDLQCGCNSSLGVCSVRRLRGVDDYRDGLSGIGGVDEVKAVVFLKLTRTNRNCVRGLGKFSSGLDKSMDRVRRYVSRVLLRRSRCLRRLASPCTELNLIVNVTKLRAMTTGVRGDTTDNAMVMPTAMVRPRIRGMRPEMSIGTRLFGRVGDDRPGVVRRSSVSPYSDAKLIPITGGGTCAEAGPCHEGNGVFYRLANGIVKACWRD